MRIAFIGNFSSPFTTENDLLKTLHILGHEVTTYQEDMKDGHKGCSPDVVIWCHTHGWDVLDWPDQWPVRIPVVAFTLDLFRGLARHDADYVKTHPWFTCDYFFQPDDPAYLRSQGVNAFFSAPAILETSAYLAAPDPLHEAYGKVIFVGSRAYHPEWPRRQEIIDLLEKKYGDRFIHYDHNSGMRGHALNVLYASAAVVVGDSCFADPVSPYTSDRLFESLGRGALLLYPTIKWPEAFDPYFFWRYETLEDMTTNLDFLLEHPQDWRHTRSEAVAMVRKNHTYTSRLRAILEKVKP